VKLDLAGFEEYLQDRGYRPNTISTYLKVLRKASRLEEPTAVMRERKMSRSRWNVLLAAFRHYAGFAGGEAGEAIMSTLHQLPKRRFRDPEPEPPLSDEEWRDLLESVEDEDAPMRDVLILLCRTGMRVGDLGQGIERQHAETALKTGVLKIKVKGGRYRPFPISGPTEESLSDLVDVRGWSVLWQAISKKSTHAYYMAVSRALRRAGERAGISKARLHPHLLRKTVAVQALKASGADIVTVSKLLGHRDIRATQHYLNHIEPDELLTLINKMDEEREHGK